MATFLDLFFFSHATLFYMAFLRPPVRSHDGGGGFSGVKWGIADPKRYSRFTWQFWLLPNIYINE